MLIALKRFVGGALLCLLPLTGYAAIGINKGFTPATVLPNQVSVVTINLINPNTAAATSLSVLDSLPAGVTVAAGGLISNTCGGSVLAVPGSTSITLTGGTIPAAVTVSGACALQVRVTSAASGAFINTILPAQVSSSQGSSSANASATLTVSAPAAVSGGKIFAPGNVHGNGPPTRMTITLNNPNAVPLSSVAFTDTFPTTLQVASPGNAVSTCGGTVTAASGALSLSLAAGTIPANGSCTISVDMAARDPNTVFFDANSTNTIAAGAVTSAQGASNTAAISGTLRVQKAAQVTKAFAPASITNGATSTLTLTLRNFNATAITGASLSDAMPANVVVTGITGNTCGGSTSFTPGSVVLTGGTIPAAPPGVGFGTCTVTATVTSSVNGTYVNTVLAGTLGGVVFNAASGTLTVLPPTSVSVAKTFTPTSPRPQTGVATLIITLINNSPTAAAITSFTDSLATMGAGFTVAAAPAATTTCPGATLTAAAGTTSVDLSGGSIPARVGGTNGSCLISVPVQISATAPTGNRTNTIAVNGLQTSQGNNTTAVTAVLAVPAALAVAKSFSPATVSVNGITTLTITVSKPVNTLAFTGLSVTDNLVPMGSIVAPTPNLTNTCGGSVSAAPGASSIQLTGGTTFNTTAASSCTISVAIVARSTPGAATNPLAFGSVTASSALGTVTAAAASATLTINASAVTLNKSFNPINISPGDTSQLSIFFANTASSSLALTGVALSDTLPSGLQVAAVPNPSFSIFSGVGPCTPGTLSAAPGASAVGISGGSIGVNTLCRLVVDVTTTAIGTLRNVLPLGSLTSNQGVTNANTPEATLLSTGSADISVSKTSAAAQVTAGTSTIFAVVVTNLDALETAAGVDVSDTAPVGMTFTAWTCSASAGSSCSAASGAGDISVPVTLLPGGTATFSVTALVDSGYTASSIRNDVTATSTAIFDPNLGNNSAFSTVAVVRIADLGISKSNSASSVAAGADTIYSIIVTNRGPSDADNAVVSDPIVAGLNCSAVTCSVVSGTAACPAGLTVAALQGGVQIPDFNAGRSIEFELTCRVTASGF